MSKAKPTAPTALPKAGKPPKTLGQINATWATSPALNAAGVIQAYQKNVLGDVDFDGLVENLRGSFSTAEDGDLSKLEAMLIGQATALQTIFTSLARRAQSQEYQKQFNSFLSLALKAQSQSRATIQAVVELKYPRQVAFVQQANIAHGPQQVNNGPGFAANTPMQAHAEENQTQQTKLLEGKTHGSTYLDTGAASTASGSHQTVETVEAVHRTKKRRR